MIFHFRVNKKERHLSLQPTKKPLESR